MECPYCNTYLSESVYQVHVKMCAERKKFAQHSEPEPNKEKIVEEPEPKEVKVAANNKGKSKKSYKSN